MILSFNSYPFGCVIVKSTSRFCIISTNEFATACGNALGCGAQDNTTFGFAFSVSSVIVMASAKACNGCAVALSIFTTGTVAYFWKLLRTYSDSSFALSCNDGNALTAIISAYCEITCAASLMCSDLSMFIIVPSSNSNFHVSFTFKIMTCIPKFFAAFSVLRRVLKLELKNSMTNVLCFPNSENSYGFIFSKMASCIVSERFNRSFILV